MPITEARRDVAQLSTRAWRASVLLRTDGEIVQTILRHANPAILFVVHLSFYQR